MERRSASTYHNRLLPDKVLTFFLDKTHRRFAPTESLLKPRDLPTVVATDSI
jgi:hypothetical protein